MSQIKKEKGLLSSKKEIQDTKILETDLQLVSGNRGKRFGITESENKKIQLYQKIKGNWQLSTEFPLIWISDLVNLLLLTQLKNKEINIMKNNIDKKEIIQWLLENTVYSEEKIKSIIESKEKEAVKNDNCTWVENFWIQDNGVQLVLGGGRPEGPLPIWYKNDSPDDELLNLKFRSPDLNKKIEIIGFEATLDTFEPDLLNFKELNWEEEKALIIKKAKNSFSKVKASLKAGNLVFESDYLPKRQEAVSFRVGQKYLEYDKLKEGFTPIFTYSKDANLDIRIEIPNMTTSRSCSPYYSEGNHISFVWTGFITMLFRVTSNL